jgi:phenylacetate-CoA ligase
MLRDALWGAFIAAKRLKRRWRELDAFARSTPVEARFGLARRLQAQIRYFGSREDALPEWRDAARIQNPLELWRVWPELPIVTKDLLRAHFDARELKARLKVPGVVASTGGSTGEPLWYFHDKAALEARTVTGLYSRILMGWRPGMATISVWGSERDIGRERSRRARVSAFLRNDYTVDGYHLGRHTVDAVMQLIAQHRPVALYGFTSILEFVAREVLKAGIDVPRGSVAVAWNGGEMLFPEQAQLFLDAFKVPIHNLYGGRELGAIACQVISDGPLSILRPYVFVEIVDQNGRPVRAGESGRVLCTSTACRGTPFLRYEVGDAAAYSDDDRDESGIQAIAEIHGRIAGLLRLPNGKLINCIYWNHLLKEFREVHQFQVVLRSGGDVQILLKGDGFTGERERDLRNVLRHFLSDVPVQLNWVDRIPLTAQGKLVQVVREDSGCNRAHELETR